VLAACGSPTEPDSVEEETTEDPADPGQPDPDPDPQPGYTLTDPVRVRSVIDGDTIEIIRNDEVFRVRFKGVNAPELYLDSGPEAFAQEAKDFVWDTIGTKEVGLEFDSGCGDDPYATCLDIYDRLLAYVRTDSGGDLALLLLGRGLVEVYQYRGEIFDRLSAYEGAQSDAQGQHVGIWSD